MPVCYVHFSKNSKKLETALRSFVRKNGKDKVKSRKSNKSDADVKSAGITTKIEDQDIDGQGEDVKKAPVAKASKPKQEKDAQGANNGDLKKPVKVKKEEDEHGDLHSIPIESDLKSEPKIEDIYSSDDSSEELEESARRQSGYVQNLSLKLDNVTPRRPSSVKKEHEITAHATDDPKSSIPSTSDVKDKRKVGKKDSLAKLEPAAVISENKPDSVEGRNGRGDKGKKKSSGKKSSGKKSKKSSKDKTALVKVQDEDVDHEMEDVERGDHSAPKVKTENASEIKSGLAKSNGEMEETDRGDVSKHDKEEGSHSPADESNDKEPSSEPKEGRAKSAKGKRSKKQKKAGIVKATDESKNVDKGRDKMSAVNDGDKDEAKAVKAQPESTGDKEVKDVASLTKRSTDTEINGHDSEDGPVGGDTVDGLKASGGSGSRKMLKRKRKEEALASRSPNERFKRVKEDVLYTKGENPQRMSFKVHNEGIDTPSRGVKKEKMKKRLNYQGGQLSYAVNSFKYDEDSE